MPEQVGEDNAWDLTARAYIINDDNLGEHLGMSLYPGQRAMALCGFKMQLPKGYMASISPRSGLAWRDGITMVNSPGRIDQDYRGEIGVILQNTDSHEAVSFAPGMRVAQMIIHKLDDVKLEQVSEELDVTDRGEGGFGSTGE